MQGSRIFTIITAMLVFLLVAFTPIVPLMLDHYGVYHQLLAKTLIGLLTLGSGMFFVKAILNKENKEKKGALHFRLIPLIAGIALIAISWYTDLPTWIANASGTNGAIEENAEMLLPVGVRVWTSLLTLLGVLFVKFGIYRKEEIELKPPKEEGRSPVLDRIDAMEDKDW